MATNFQCLSLVPCVRWSAGVCVCMCKYIFMCESVYVWVCVMVCEFLFPQHSWHRLLCMTNGKKGSLGSHAVFSALSNIALSPLSLSLSLSFACSVFLSCALSTVAYAVNVISNACIIKMQASLSLSLFSPSPTLFLSISLSLFSVYLFYIPFLPLSLSVSYSLSTLLFSQSASDVAYFWAA